MIKEELKKIIGDKIDNFDEKFMEAYYNMNEVYNKEFIKKMVEKELLSNVEELSYNDLLKMASDLAHRHVPDNVESYTEREDGATYSEKGQKMFDEWYNYYYELLNK